MATTVQPQIRVKSYFATCITDAMDMARKELGPDALWLDSRPAAPEARHLGPLEVVFGESAESPKKEEPATSSVAAEIDDLRNKMDEIRNLLVRTTSTKPYGGTRARLVEQVLIDAGLTVPLADELDEAVYLRIKAKAETDISRPRRIQEIEPELVFRVTQEEMNARIETTDGIGRVTALVGPPGSGKTSTLVKLAIREGLMKGRSVKLISTDTQRIAASEQLKIYAAILGVQFQVAESSAALAHAVDTAHPTSLVLIDTPGLSPALLEDTAADLSTFFRHRQDIDVHLVLTASMRQTDMEKVVARFAIFRPAATIFTRLDETDSLATLFCEVVRNKIPVSYLCNGQIVPEDIEPATKDRITEGLVRRLPGVLQSAA
jgi:flagellar biosynthesis protein FlhF